MDEEVAMSMSRPRMVSGMDGVLGYVHFVPGGDRCDKRTILLFERACGALIDFYLAKFYKNYENTSGPFSAV